MQAERRQRVAALAMSGIGAAMFVSAVVFVVLGWGRCLPDAIVGNDGARACASLIASNDVGGAAETLGFASMGLLFTALGSVLGAKRGSNPLGWIFGLAGLTFTANALANVWMIHSAEAPGSLPLAGAFGVVSEVIGGPVVFAPFVFFFLLFPDGHLPSRRWRFVAWLTGAAVAAQTLSLALRPGPLRLSPQMVNPLGASWLVDDIADAVDMVTFSLLLAGLALGAVSLVVRFRRSRGVGRQQLKWFTTASAFAGLTLVLGPVFWSVPAIEPLWGVLFLLATGAIPAAATLAILRYRLYDLDVIVNRALVYGALTGLLGAVYLGSVVVMQTVMSGLGGGSDVAVAASTLAVAALFRPARARVQEFINRRFYRRKYDALHTVETFSSRLRQETDVATLRSELLQAVQTTIQPARAVVWLRGDQPSQ